MHIFATLLALQSEFQNQNDTKFAAIPASCVTNHQRSEHKSHSLELILGS